MCPTQCPHFPFGIAGYDLSLRVDGTWTSKAADYVINHIGQDSFNELVTKCAFSQERGEDAFAAFFGLALYQALFFQPDPNGRTLSDQWAAEGWRGLNNDEQVMMRYRRHSFPTIIETQRVVSDHATECIDLLAENPRSFIVCDRHTADGTARFTKLLIWICHYPHYTRIGPAGIPLSDSIAEAFIEEVRRMAPRRQRGLSLKDYLRAHFADCCEVQQQMAQQWTQRMLQGMDAYQCVAVYDLKGTREQVESILRAKPDFELDEGELTSARPPDTTRYAWLRKGESKQLEKRMPSFFQHRKPEEGFGLIGSIELDAHQLRVEAFSKQKFKFAKKMTAKYFGRLLQFHGETIIDLAKQMAQRRNENVACERPAPAEEKKHAAIPPDIQQKIMEAFYRNFYQKFLDESIPLLHGMTPRAAAQNPAMRSQLINLIKQHIHGMDRNNREHGIHINIDWLLDELQLHELK